jgi:hypothetical protein
MDEVNPLDSYSPFDTPEPIFARSSLSHPSSTLNPLDDVSLHEYEQRLNALEAQLATQEHQLTIAQQTGAFDSPPNWPRFHPVIHFDPTEIPEHLRGFATEAMFAWSLMSATLALNFVACLALLRAGDAADSPGSKIALSALYVFLVVPIALDLSVLAVYKALRTGGVASVTYMKIFAFVGAITLFLTVLTLGFESSGSCGLVTMINLFVGGHGGIGVIALAVTAGLAGASWCYFRLLKGLLQYYRGTEQGAGDLAHNVRMTVAGLVVGALR